MKIEITYKSLPIVVEYKYIPGEKCIKYDNDLSGYPGYPEQIKMCYVFHAGEDITDFIYELPTAWGEIEELILEEINKRNE